MHLLLLAGLQMATVQDVASLLKEADDLFKAQKYDEARSAYEKTAAAAEKEPNRSTQVEALAQIARCFSLRQDLKEGRTWLAKAEALATPDDPQGWSRTLGVRGIFEREEGNREKSKKTFIEMYEYCSKQKLHRRAVDAIHHLAIVVPPQEQPLWALKGIAEAEKLGDESWLAVLWNNLGATYEDLKQYKEMQGAYLNARSYHYKTGDDAKKLAADWAVGHGHRLLGENKEAREILEKTLHWAQERYQKEATVENAEWVGWSKKDLGQTVFALGDRDKGISLVREARKVLVDSGIEKWWPEGLKQLDSDLKAMEEQK